MEQSIKPQSAIVAAVLFLVIPLPWLIAWLLAAVFHEACHCIAVLCCNGHLDQIEIGLGGVEIRSSLENNWQSLICSLAGPAGGMLLLVFAECFPRLAICALLQTTYNLLPIYPLDGGHILYSIISTICPSNLGATICRSVEIVIIAVMIVLSVVLCLRYNLGSLPFLLVMIFLLRTKKIKIPCKWRL